MVTRGHPRYTGLSLKSLEDADPCLIWWTRNLPRAHRQNPRSSWTRRSSGRGQFREFGDWTRRRGGTWPVRRCRAQRPSWATTNCPSTRLINFAT